jgi:hypothetical protein
MLSLNIARSSPLSSTQAEKVIQHHHTENLPHNIVKTMSNIPPTSSIISPTDLLPKLYHQPRFRVALFSLAICQLFFSVLTGAVLAIKSAYAVTVMASFLLVTYILLGLWGFYLRVNAVRTVRRAVHDIGRNVTD